MCGLAQNGPKWGNPGEKRLPGNACSGVSMPGGTVRRPDSTLTGAGRGRVCGGAWQGTGGGDCDTIGATTNIRRVLSAPATGQRHRLE